MAEPIIIFDWDDTLLCSTHLAGLGCKVTDTTTITDPILIEYLKVLAVTVEQVLTLAATLGKVHIITGAESGWVQLSAQVFYPTLVPYLEKVSVISARSTYETTLPLQPPWMWKHHAMFSILGEAKTLVTMGDSSDERIAALKLGELIPGLCVKVVKFDERPTPQTLYTELLYMLAQLKGYMTATKVNVELQRIELGLIVKT